MTPTPSMSRRAMLQRSAGGFGFLALQALLAQEQAKAAVANPLAAKQPNFPAKAKRIVFLFMKGTPDFPMCGFSGRIVQILDYLGLEYQSANVLENQELREGIKAYTNWPTIPQLYVKGEFIGGADIVTEMFQAGELQTHLADKGIAVKQTA